MTFKYTDFYESPVMRNLAKIAIDEGLVGSSDVERSVAKMNENKALEPSGDLFADAAKLAAALRKKGYTEEAEGIEEKLFLFKQAEAQLYDVSGETGEDLIDFAHQDGEAEVAPSSGGYGVVETEITSHKKILDVVNKVPTGKYASEIEKMLLLARESLGVEKKAQPVPWGHKAGPVPATEPEATAEPGSLNREEISAISDRLLDSYDKIRDLQLDLNEALNTSWDGFNLTEDKIFAGGKPREYYSTAGRIDLDRINSFTKKYTAAYGGKTRDGEVGDIVGVINSKGYGDLLGWSRTIGAWPGFFTGSRPHSNLAEIKAKLGGGIASDGPASIWEIVEGPGGAHPIKVPLSESLLSAKAVSFRKNSGTVQFVAAEIHARLSAERVKIFSGVDRAKTKIKGIVDKVKQEATFKDQNLELQVEVTGKNNAPDILRNVNGLRTHLAGFQKGRDFGIYNKLIEDLGGQQINISGITSGALAIITEINSSLDRVLKAGPTQGMHGALVNFKRAKEIFVRQMGSIIDKNSEEYQNAAARSSRSARFIVAIQAGLKSGDFKDTQQAMQSENTKEQWIAGSEQWLASAVAISKGASNKAELIKLATFAKFATDFDARNTTAKDPKGGGAAPSKQPAHKPSGRMPRRKDKEIKIGTDEAMAVMPMQEALNDLGSLLNRNRNIIPELTRARRNRMISLLLATGTTKGPHASIDGKWSSNTWIALDASRIVTQFWNKSATESVEEVFSGEKDKGYHNKDNTIDRANENTTILNKLINALGGGADKGRSYGKYTLGYSGISDVEIFTNNLASLGDLLNFIVEKKGYDYYTGGESSVISRTKFEEPSKEIEQDRVDTTAEAQVEELKVDDSATSIAKKFKNKLQKKAQERDPKDYEPGGKYHVYPGAAGTPGIIGVDAEGRGIPQRDRMHYVPTGKVQRINGKDILVWEKDTVPGPGLPGFPGAPGSAAPAGAAGGPAGASGGVGLTKEQWNNVLDDLKAAALLKMKEGGASGKRAIDMARRVQGLRERELNKIETTAGGIVPVGPARRGRSGGWSGRGQPGGYSMQLGGGGREGAGRSPIDFTLDLSNAGVWGDTGYNYPIYYQQLYTYSRSPDKIAAHLGFNKQVNKEEAFNRALYVAGIPKNILNEDGKSYTITMSSGRKHSVPLMKNEKFRVAYNRALMVDPLGKLRVFLANLQGQIPEVFQGMVEQGWDRRQLEKANMMAAKWQSLISTISSNITSFHKGL